MQRNENPRIGIQIEKAKARLISSEGCASNIERAAAIPKAGCDPFLRRNRPKAMKLSDTSLNERTGYLL